MSAIYRRVGRARYDREWRERNKPNFWSCLLFSHIFAKMSEKELLPFHISVHERGKFPVIILISFYILHDFLFSPSNYINFS